MKLFDREQDKTEETTAAALQTQVAEEKETRKDGAKREDTANMEMKNESSPSEQAGVGRNRSDGLSLIGKTLFVKGAVEAAEDMLVEGRIEGSIKHTADRLIVGVSGVVNADIDAKNLVVEGTVEGNIVGSESVVIKESADVRGNIYTARISIADGAQFSGTVDMDLSKSPKH